MILVKKTALHVFTPGDAISASTQMGTKLQFVVTATTPASPVVVTDKTEFKQGRLVKLSDTQGSRVTYDDLGGLKDGIQKIREMVELPMRHPEIFETLDVEVSKMLSIVRIPSGTTKMHYLLQKPSQENKCTLRIQLSGPQIMDKHYGALKQKLEMFHKLEKIPLH